jgi:hypothetical protein
MYSSRELRIAYGSATTVGNDSHTLGDLAHLLQLKLGIVFHGHCSFIAGLLILLLGPSVQVSGVQLDSSRQLG